MELLGEVPESPVDVLLKKALELYKGKFVRPIPLVAAQAPARVNIIGDHVDYNQGFVLPIAIPLFTTAIAAPNSTHEFNVVTHNTITDVTFETSFLMPSVEPLEKSEPHWANVIKGVLQNFKGYVLEGCNVVFVSNIPWNVGLASSTSLAVCTYTLLEGITKEKTYQLTDKALRVALAEAEFTHAPPGILDAFAIIMCQEGKALFTDCKTHSVKQLALNTEKYAFLIIQTEEKRKRASKKFKKRIDQCREAARIMGLNYLREAGAGHLKAFRDKLKLNEAIDMRARHVVAENSRVERAVQAISNGDYLSLGRLMNQSHVSLRYDFEVSTKLLDDVVDVTLYIKGVLGSRMHGFGGGGCVLSLMRKNAINEVMSLIEKKISEPLHFFVADPIGGTEDVSNRIFNIGRDAVKITTGLITLMEYAVEAYHSHFDSQPTVAAHAPGRVNIMGDHTEYNDGYLLQMALPVGTVVVGSVNGTQTHNIYVERDYAGDESDHIAINAQNLLAEDCTCDSWGSLIRGVLICFHSKIEMGFNAMIVASLPPMTGLGCYSALVVALYTFLESLYKDPLIMWQDKAARCFEAETLFTKRNATVADHMTIIASIPNHVTFIDCRTNDLEFVKFPVKKFTFILGDTNLDRYKTRMKHTDRAIECKELAQVLQVKSLRDVDTDDLEQNSNNMTKELFRRGVHIVSEMNRVYQAARSIKKVDLTSLGLLMVQSHNSLINNYRVTCAAQERLVSQAMNCEGVLGSRMTGSDFSTCTLILVRRPDANSVIEKIHSNYNGHVMLYHIDPRGGTKDVTDVLKLIMSKLTPRVDKFEQPLSEDSLKTEDVRSLSWDLFDFGNQWEKWDEKNEDEDTEEEVSHEELSEEERIATESIPFIDNVELTEYPYGETHASSSELRVEESVEE